MQYHFTQSVRLGGKDYTRGTHEVPDFPENTPDEKQNKKNAEANAHFLKFVSAGFIVEADQAKTPTLETPAERAKRLHAKIVAQKNGLNRQSAASAEPAKEAKAKDESEEESFLAPPPKKKSR
jgi:hypothetical protein